MVASRNMLRAVLLFVVALVLTSDRAFVRAQEEDAVDTQGEDSLLQDGDEGEESHSASDVEEHPDDGEDSEPLEPVEPIGDENEISAVLNAAEADSETVMHGPISVPPAPPVHTLVVDKSLIIDSAMSCGMSGRLPEESAFKTKLRSKVRCRRGWMEWPTKALLFPNTHQSYKYLREQGVVKGDMEVIAVSSVDEIPLKHARSTMKQYAGQNQFFIHSTKKHGNAVLADRMLRMTAAQQVAIVVSTLEEAKSLTQEWIDAVDILFKDNPKLGIVGGHAAIIGGKPYANQGGGFKFAELLVGGPLAVRREAYMQASVYLTSSETCGRGVGECADAGQNLSSRIWAAGFQVGFLGTTRGIPPNPCPEILGKAEKASVKQLALQAQTLLDDRKPTEAATSGFKTTCTCNNPARAEKATAVVQYFKRPEGVKPIAANFNSMPDLEVIVNDDSRTEGERWITALKNGFVAYTHDIHEIRGYNRYSRFANTDYVALMQDDDVPKDRDWVKRAATLFGGNPKLGMIGGFRGRMDVGSRFDKSTGQMFGKKYGPKYLAVPLKERKTGIAYMPCYKVNAAPLFIDRRVLFELGGLNGNFSCVGESGIDFDFEYSIRLWKTGYEVGLGEFRIRHGAMDKSGAASKTGTRASKKKFARRRAAERFNNAQLYAMFKPFHHKKGTALAMAAFNRQRSSGRGKKGRGKKLLAADLHGYDGYDGEHDGEWDVDVVSPEMAAAEFGAAW